MTLALFDSMTAVQEFVVPRSIPIILSTENAARRDATIQVRDWVRAGGGEKLKFEGEIIEGL